MLELSPKAYAIIVIILCFFLVATGGLYVSLLGWMTVNGVDATGTAFNRLEIFVVGNLGLLIGSIFKPSKL